MKKNIRLTENELINLVRRIVNEQMENYWGPSCEDLMSNMRDIYEETQSFISRKSDEINVYTVYDVLEMQLVYLVDMAEEMECDNYYDLREMYEEYTETIAEILKI
jgi:hypothetical protein